MLDAYQNFWVQKKLTHSIRASQAEYNIKVAKNIPAHKALLNLKMSLPLIGSIGKVSKNADIRHIAKPVLPINAKPLLRRIKKKAANPKVIKTAAHARNPPRRSVKLRE